MYRNILVPVVIEDGTQDKARHALDLAQRLSAEAARITVLHVLEDVPGYVAAYVPKEIVASSRQTIEAEVTALAGSVAGGEARIISGHAGRKILDYAKDNANDLIIVSSHRPGMQDLLLGSTATHIVRHATAAVHVTR